MSKSNNPNPDAGKPDAKADATSGDAPATPEKQPEPVKGQPEPGRLPPAFFLLRDFHDVFTPFDWKRRTGGWVGTTKSSMPGNKGTLAVIVKGPSDATGTEELPPAEAQSACAHAVVRADQSYPQATKIEVYLNCEPEPHLVP